MSDNELLLTTLTNPVDPLEREITPIPAVPGATLADYIAGALPTVGDDLDLVASVNGLVVKDLQACRPKIGDSILLKVVPHGGGGGGGKDIVRTVALLAVMITAPGIGQALVPGALMQYPLAVAGIKAAVGLAGGMLVNAILPPAVPDLPAFSPADLGEYSPTYAWNTIGNLDIEGKAWPALYGTMRVYPYLISQHITTDGDQQYLNLLYAVADHAVDSITDIEINGNPSTYYDGIEIETRLGSNSQTAISYFNDTISEKASGAKLSTSWTTIRTDSNVVEGLGVAVSCPGGLYYANDEGSLSEQTLRIAIEHKKVGDVSWTAWDEETITEATREPVRRVYRKDDLNAGEYDVRVKFAAEPNTGARYGTIAYYDYIQEVVYDDFAYPGTSLLAIRALATDQLSGAAPRVSCLATRSTVDVYEPGTGWTTKPANLPPWASYDAHVNGDYGGNVAYGRMLYHEFDEWASYCAANSYFVNLYLDSGMTTPKALEQIGTPGRGQVLQRGTKFGCVVDKPVTRSGFYGMGNIVKGSFEETFLEKKDRANVVEITYFDADLEYTRQTIRLFASNYDPTTDEENVSAIVLYGCTSKTQAIKHGTFVLNCNQHLLRVISFDARADAIGCQVGDMIEFAHDVPQWGTSGRLVTATATGAYLDRDITMVAGQTYKLMVRHYNTDIIEEVTIEASDYTGRQVTIAAGGTWSQTPKFCDIYSFGLSTNVTKQFRVINLTRSTKMHRKLTALEYKADVYSDSGTLPAFETPATFNFVQELTAAEIWRDGTGQGVIHLSWRGEAILWRVFFRQTGSSHWIKAGETSQRSYDVAALVPGQTYDFSVTGSTTPGNVSGESATVTETFNGWGNQSLIAPRVRGLEVLGQGNDTVWQDKDLRLRWNPVVNTTMPAGGEVHGAGTFPPYAEFSYYRIQILNSDGTVRQEKQWHDNHYTYTHEMNLEDGQAASLIVKVWAVMKTGAQSESAAVISVSNPAPAAVSGLSASPWMGGMQFDWVQNSEVDFSHYSYRVQVESDGWTGWTTTTANVVFRSLTATEESTHGREANVQIEVKAVDTFGNESTTQSTNGDCDGLNIQHTDINDFAITASKLFTKIPVVSGDAWTDDSPAAGSVAWNAHTVYYNGVAYAIAAGNTNQKYIYWVNGAGTYTASDTNPTLVDGDFIIATNIDGAHDLAWNAVANELIGSAYIQNLAVLEAHIADLAVTNAKIANLDAAKITTGFIAAARIQAASLVISHLSTDVTGRMFTNSTRDFADLGGATKPEDYATQNTIYRQTTQPTGSTGDLWYDTDDDLLYRHNGTSWELVGNGYDNTNQLTDGASLGQTAVWNTVTGANKPADNATVGADWETNLTNIPDKLVQTFYQSAAPSTGMATGDYWVDSGDDKTYRYSGSAWVLIQDADIAQALSDAADAQSTADGKINTFIQASAPTAVAVGDLWLDSDDGNHMYRWSGSAWVDVKDTNIAQAITDAAGAQATADGKVTTFYQSATPTAEGTGDLWVDTGNGNVLKRWSGSAWANVQDSDIGTAITDAATAQSTADGAQGAANTAQATADGKVTTFYQTAQPTAEGTGDLWVDTDNGNKLYRWSGSAWVSVQDADISQALSDAATAQSTADGKIVTFYQAGQPTAEGSGDIWFDTDDGYKQYRWSGSAWVAVQDSGISQAISDAATAQSTADGKITTFYQTTAPTAEGVGDIWVDTDDDNKPYRWSGSAWIAIEYDVATWTKITGTGKPADNATENTIYRQSAEPTGSTGDIWFDTDDNKLYRHSGSAWELVGNSYDNTSQLTDGANLGQTAVWTSVTSRPTELTDGRISAGLNSSGEVKQMIKGGNLPTTTPSVSGLYMNATYIGYYDTAGGSWPVYIKNDGTFLFQVDADHYFENDGTSFKFKGQFVVDPHVITGNFLGRYHTSRMGDQKAFYLSNSGSGSAAFVDAQLAEGAYAHLQSGDDPAANSKAELKLYGTSPFSHCGFAAYAHVAKTGTGSGIVGELLYGKNDTAGDDFFGFRTYQDGTWKAVNSDGISETTTTITAPVLPNTLLRAHYDSDANEIRFHVDGTLEATHTTNLPSGNSTVFFSIKISNSSAVSETPDAYLRFKLRELSVWSDFTGAFTGGGVRWPTD